MLLILIMIILFILILFFIDSTPNRSNLSTLINDFELINFEGRWYNIACMDIDDKINMIVVKTSSNDLFIEYEGSTIHGFIYPVTASHFNVLYQDYQKGIFHDLVILDIDDSYHNALVGSINRKHLMILSKSPVLTGKVIYHYLQKSYELGYDIHRIRVL